MKSRPDNAKQSKPAPRRGRGWWIPWTFVAGFAVVIGANGALIYFSMATWSGLETEGYYEKGLAYNEALSGAQSQAALGWRVKIDFAPAGRSDSDGARARVSITLRDRDGRPLTGADVRARFVRPTQSGLDSETVLPDLGQGRYGADVTLARPGQWDLVLLASVAGVSYQAVERVYLPR